MNKRVSQGIGTSLPMGRLGSELAGIFKNLSRECIGTNGFSVVPDFMSRRPSTHSRVKTGRPGKEATTRNFLHLFEVGIKTARVNELRKRHLKRVSGQGLDSKYIAVSARTVREAINIVRYEGNSGCPDYEERVDSALHLLRCIISSSALYRPIDITFATRYF